MPDIAVRPLTDADHGWVEEFIIQRWGSPIMIGHGVIYTISELPGFVADIEGERVGLLTYDIQGRACEIVSLDSTRPGVGTALMEAIKSASKRPVFPLFSDVCFFVKLYMTQEKRSYPRSCDISQRICFSRYI